MTIEEEHSESQISQNSVHGNDKIHDDSDYEFEEYKH